MKDSGWLLFFYSVPSKPVSSRMKVWRRLAKSGAAQFKGAAYILPFNDENYELFQWLAADVAAMRGEAAFVRVESIETVKNSEIINIFNKQREKEYGTLMKSAEDLDRKISSIKKGSCGQDNKKLVDCLGRLERDFNCVKKLDFFSSKKGDFLGKQISSLDAGLKEISGARAKEHKITLYHKGIEDYQNKIWVTRKRPFIDRMASAWLIRKFIDRKPIFKFIDEKEIAGPDKNSVAYDIKGGEFTHKGDMCTFEVLVKSFGIKDKNLKKIAELVHELDIKDEKYRSAEAKGVEEIILGIRKTSGDDSVLLDKGMSVFEMLYASKA